MLRVIWRWDVGEHCLSTLIMWSMMRDACRVSYWFDLVTLFFLPSFVHSLLSSNAFFYSIPFLFSYVSFLSFAFSLLLTSFTPIFSPQSSRHLFFTVTIIFVIGGVTTSEIRMVNELVASSSQDKQILLWSNKLLRPDDILRTTLQPEMDFLWSPMILPMSIYLRFVFSSLLNS